MICGKHVPENVRMKSGSFETFLIPVRNILTAVNKTLVGIYHWAAGHNKASWRETESFIPERWLGDEKFASDISGVISPFQAGPRNCIGQNLAMGEIRFVMAKLLWK